MVKKWLITGGCGFIGCNLIKSLLNEGIDYIRIVDDLSVGSRKDLGRVCSFSERSHGAIFNHPPGGKRVELIVGDIRNFDLAQAACHNIDIVVHLAANTGVTPSVEDPLMDCHINVLGTLNYLEASRLNAVDRFIFASSGAPAGKVDPPIHEEIVPHPVSPYGASKLAGEAYCSAYYNSFGLDTIGLRFGNVFGPLSNKKESVIAKFIRCSMLSEPITIYGDGSQTRDFIFVEDLVEAITKASIAESIGGELFQIATNCETTVNEIVNLLIDLFPRYGIPVPKIVLSEPRPGEVQRNFSDISKAQKILGWKNKHSLVKALEKTIAWFIDEI
jgi:UDP-glucose 4-epimerase